PGIDAAHAHDAGVISGDGAHAAALPVDDQEPIVAEIHENGAVSPYRNQPGGQPRLARASPFADLDHNAALGEIRQDHALVDVVTPQHPAVGELAHASNG